MGVDRTRGPDDRTDGVDQSGQRNRPPAPPPDRPGSPRLPSRRESLRTTREAQTAAAAEKLGPRGSGRETGAAGSIDESEKSFDSAERRIADLLKAEGCEVKALRESPQHGVRTPDATVNGMPMEFKSLREGAGSNTLKNALNSAKGQAGNAIVDARDSGLEQSAAQTGLNRFLQVSRDRMNSIRIVGDKYDLRWSGE